MFSKCTPEFEMNGFKRLKLLCCAVISSAVTLFLVLNPNLSQLQPFCSIAAKYPCFYLITQRTASALAAPHLSQEHTYDAASAFNTTQIMAVTFVELVVEASS